MPQTFFFLCLFVFRCLNAHLAYDAGDVLDSVSRCNCMFEYVLMASNREANLFVCCVVLCCLVFLVLCCLKRIVNTQRLGLYMLGANSFQ